MYNILTLNKISETGTCRFSNEYVCSADAQNPDAVLVRSASMHEFDFNSNMLAIARAGAGVNNIPVANCSEKGIIVFNTPGANANAVKELVITGLLLSSRKVLPAIEWAKTLKGNGDTVPKDVEKGKSAFAGPEITGKTLGLVGLGAIGILVANAATALGMNVIGYDPFLSAEKATELNANVQLTAELDDIFTKSDYISLHAPLNDGTRGMVNKTSIAKMKSSVRILNFARGELVDTNDILSALENGDVNTYVTDFPNDALINVEGVIAIPHLGASTPESEDNCAIMAVDQISNFLENGNIVNSVNFPAISIPASDKKRVTVIYKSSAEVDSYIASAFVGTNTVSKAKGDYAYAIIEGDFTAEAVDSLNQLTDIIKVRVIK